MAGAGGGGAEIPPPLDFGSGKSGLVREVV